LSDAAAAASLCVGLPGYLRQQVDVETARREVAGRLAARPSLLLAAIQRQAARPGPYARLLRHAGLTFGDAERLIAQEGVEGALRAIAQAGVYLSLDELRGRRDVVRGSLRFRCSLRDLRPGRRAGLVLQSSGTRGHGTEAGVGLASVREQVANLRLALAARGDTGWSRALWAVPGSVALVVLLYFAALGPDSPRWFTPIDPATPGLHPRYRWSARLLTVAGRLLGRSLPAPVSVSLQHPRAVLDWALGVRQQGATPLVWTFCSPAVRLARAAESAGLALRGVEIMVGGEPYTAARRDTIRASGATVFPQYASMEAGFLAFGCLQPEAVDDMHLMSDLHAVIPTAGGDGPTGLLPGTLLVTALSPRPRFGLLNAALGDAAALSARACGCPLERVGWATHLAEVRALQKVTVGGLTLLDADLLRVLEQDLPARFGGGPTDYQLVETEAADGQAVLRLLVDPRLPRVDERALVEQFYALIGPGSGVERLVALQWRQGDWLRVERRTPLSTPAGKVVHLLRGAEGAIRVQLQAAGGSSPARS
jgi:hypothetical protein